MAKSNGERIAELLVKANDYVNQAYQIALSEKSTAIIEEKPKKTRKAKAPKVAAEKRQWVLKTDQRGRVPAWVLAQHNAPDKADLLRRFGEDHRFCEK